jgi:myo-inositol-1(or 4)-monophosphatase
MNISHADLSFVEAVARDAGTLLMRYQRDGFAVEHKGSIDLVTTADRESERLIVSSISTRYPSHAIISEEEAYHSGHHGGRGAVWYVDPLDGTTDFVHRYPNFAVSIALYIDHEPALAVIFDPMRAELFAARRGGGATLNGRPIAVSQTSRLIESLLTSGFPYDVLESGRNIEAYQRLTLLTRGVRIGGSAALDLAWVACGRLDGYWEPELNSWDAAAGVLIVREAGGRVSDLSGENWQPSLPGLAATNTLLHSLLLKEI